MSDREIITFVIAAYNAEKTLDRAIESILKQPLKYWRLIVVDDGSTDDTAIVARKYTTNYPDKITYIWQENKRQGAARNTGMKYVETEYVSFLDADDWLMNDYVEHIVGMLNSLPTDQYPQIIMTLPIKWDENTEEYSEWMDKSIFEEIFSEDGKIVNPREVPRLFQTEVNVCRKVLRVDYLKTISFAFQEGIKWEDVVPHFELLSKCVSCMGVYTGFYYRIGSPEQTTATRGTDRLDIIPVLHSLYEYCEEIDDAMLLFPVMRVIVRFSIWCIRMSDAPYRKIIVNELHKLYKLLPNKYYIALREGSKREYSRKNSLMYRLFMTGMKYRLFKWVFYNDTIQKICEILLRTILHAKGKVE